MKRTFIIIALLVGCMGFSFRQMRPVAASSGPFQPAVTSGLVSWWPFGGNLTDNWTGGNNGTPTGSPSYVAGPQGGSANAISLDGSTQWADFGNASNINPPAMTVVVWVKFNSLTPAYSTVFSRNDGSLAVQLFVKSNGKLAVYLSASSYDGTGANTLVVGTWYQIAFTYDSASGLIGYVAPLGGANAVDGTGIANSTIPSISANTFLGLDEHNGSRLPNASFEGLKIYNRALTPVEINSLFLDGK